MEYCIAMTISGDPCPYPATIGDYCILHARGWDDAKANVAMLWAVYGGLTSLLGIISALQVIFGASAVVKLGREGETRALNLAEMKDSAETMIRMLNLFVPDDSRSEVENIGKSVVQLHKDVLSLVEHAAVQSTKAQASAEERRT